MPLPLEPGGVCKVVLTADRHKNNPPAFLFPYLSGRQQQKLMRTYEFCDASVSGAPMDVRSLFSVLSELIVGWEHIDKPFDPAELDTVINVAEAFELINLLVLQGPGTTLKNGFGSPSA